MKNYYGALDHIDWVAYYRTTATRSTPAVAAGPAGQGGCSRVNYAPVVVSPA